MPDLKDLIEATIHRPAPTPRFAVGQQVRIRKTLQCNVHAVQEMLGKTGIVEAIEIATLSKRVWYQVRVGDRVEPFEEYELDWRYRR